jgi:hypothetical protein
LEHSIHYLRIDLRIIHSILARRSDEDLARKARLGIEGDGIGIGGMRALEISKFDQLVAQEARVTVCDKQMAFARMDIDSRYELARGGASG